MKQNDTTGKEKMAEEMTSAGINRRSFLIGAAGVGALVASSGLFACAPKDGAGSASGAGNAAGSASGGAASAANGKPAFMVAPEPVEQSQIKETVEADVVIVGAGFSGLVCALAAAESGAKVVLLERMNKVIGRGGSIFAMNTNLTKEKGYSIEIGQVFKRMMGYHSYRIDGNKWMLHYHKSSEAMNWLMDRMKSASSVGGSDLTPVMEHWYEDPENINGEFPGTHEFLDGPNGKGPDDNPQQDVCDNVAAYCVKAGVDIKYQFTAEQLVKDGDRVIGVVGTDETGGYVQVNGSKGVVMATGDFGTDEEMMKALIPWVPGKASGGIWEGTGHKMAYWAGAAVDRSATPAPMIFCFQWRSITRQVRAFQGLMLNSDGKRYTNEDNVISHGGLSLMHEKGNCGFAIWDTAYASEPQWQNHRYVDGPKVFENEQEVIAYWDEIVASSGTIDMNGSGALEVRMVRDDTIEGLISQLGLPADQAKASIERYNGFCDAGKDDDFDKRKELLLPIKTGPFYGIKCTPWFLTTTGGIRCNEKLQVQNENDEVIDGLYCLGSMVGDMYNNCYSTHFPGHNLGSTCLTFGYVTGKYLAEEA
jgi:succinate dehydrogenase/fumarate reductase flavoprotein subunit